MGSWRVSPGLPVGEKDDDDCDDERDHVRPPIDVVSFDGSLLRILGAASRALSARLSDELQLVGVTSQQWLVLQEVAHARYIEPSEVAKNLEMTRPTVTEILRRLRERGLVASETRSFDARRRVHRPTSLGSQVVERGLVHANRVVGQATVAMTQPDQVRLGELLAQVSSNLAAARKPSLE